MGSLERPFDQLNLLDADIKLILERSKDQLKEINTDDAIVRSIIELELQTITTKLKHFM